MATEGPQPPTPGRNTGADATIAACVPPSSHCPVVVRFPSAWDFGLEPTIGSSSMNGHDNPYETPESSGRSIRRGAAVTFVDCGSQRVSSS